MTPLFSLEVYQQFVPTERMRWLFMLYNMRSGAICAIYILPIVHISTSISFCEIVYSIINKMGMEWNFPRRFFPLNIRIYPAREFEYSKRPWLMLSCVICNMTSLWQVHYCFRNVLAIPIKHIKQLLRQSIHIYMHL